MLCLVFATHYECHEALPLFKSLMYMVIRKRKVSSTHGIRLEHTEHMRWQSSRLPENPGPNQYHVLPSKVLGPGLIWQAYLELTIGNSKWPIGGGEFLSSDGPQPGWQCLCCCGCNTVEYLNILNACCHNSVFFDETDAH